jgi:hypothetical protein
MMLPITADGNWLSLRRKAPELPGGCRDSPSLHGPSKSSCRWACQAATVRAGLRQLGNGLYLIEIKEGVLTSVGKKQLQSQWCHAAS